MSAPILHFERAEFDSRLNKTRAAMESHGIELLIVTDPANMAWLSGYDGWSFYVPQCVAVPLAEPPLWFGRGQDANGARRTVFPMGRKIKNAPPAIPIDGEKPPVRWRCQGENTLPSADFCRKRDDTSR